MRKVSGNLKKDAETQIGQRISWRKLNGLEWLFTYNARVFRE